jgi:hypothetical protein
VLRGKAEFLEGGRRRLEAEAEAHLRRIADAEREAVAGLPPGAGAYLCGRCAHLVTDLARHFDECEGLAAERSN